MPTVRSGVILLLAGALYLVANQTQVGWVYVMSSGLVGLLLAAFLYQWGTLGGIQVERTFRSPQTPGGSRPAPVTGPQAELTTLYPDVKPPDFFEDDPIDITLAVRQRGLRPAFLIAGSEVCPPAPPAEREQPFFIPGLFKNRTALLTYQTTCYRRGFHTFPPLTLRSGGPFSLVRSRRRLDAAEPDGLLVYPYYRPLKRLRLLENRGFTDKQALRVGHSSEVIGVRDYRSGDSLRQIHWRSTARTGRLIVKEFSDNDHLTMRVVLDLSKAGSLGPGKYSTFETAVRITASLGYYATHQNIPFYLSGRSQQWTPPDIALSWWGVLHYLARVQNDGVEPLETVLHQLPSTPFVVALVSHPSPPVMRQLAALPRRGIRTLAILITPNDEPPSPNAPPTAEGLTVVTASPTTWETTLAGL